jgi:hypothetical protein
MKRYSLFLLSLLACASVYAQTQSATPATDDGNFYSRFSTRVNAIQSQQPAWPPPIVTTYTGLFQVARTDIVRQITPTHGETWNYDNSKGVSFIPFNHVEFDVDLPPLLTHNAAPGSTAKTPIDGAGDMSFLGKYRFLSGNEQHGTYNVSAYVLATIPTGSYKNGSTDASIAPNLALGKGFGPLAIQTTAGTTLYMEKPATSTSGNPIAWNLAAQYRIHKIFWPEIESNATYYKGGTNHGREQEFVTPGLLIGKCKLHPEDPHSRGGFAFGAGMQIATSQYHAYNHSLVTTARFIF